MRGEHCDGSTVYGKALCRWEAKNIVWGDPIIIHTEIDGLETGSYDLYLVAQERHAENDLRGRDHADDTDGDDALLLADSDGA